jgi:hypothetical protein
MDPKRLIRDAGQVKACLHELPDGRVVAIKEVKIYIPARFAERDLAYVGVEKYILGIYAITSEDMYYGVSLVNAMIPIDPAVMNRMKINEDEYLEFVFPPGSTVFKSTSLVRTDTLTYRIYDEIFSNGKIPWYVGYEELGHIFDTAQHHAGANVGANQEVTQLIASMVARDPTDRTKYYRTKVQSLSELRTDPPAFVSLKSVEYSSTNTTNKLGGSYMSIGIVSALISPATRKERIEALLTL